MFCSLILVLVVVVSVQTTGLVSANGIPAPPIGRVYIQSDGTVEPSTAPIHRDGDIYTLTDNMPNSTIVVKRDNIVIDGAGYGIHGYSTSYYDGIIISYRTNITIKNMNISPFGYAIRMDYASNNTIIGNTMQAFTGVSLLYSDNNKIIQNTMTDGYGVQGSGSNNLIAENNFTSGLEGGGNGMGVYTSGNNNTITQNFFSHELSIQIPLSSYNTISNNTIIDGRTGILLGRSSHNLVFGNIIKGKTDSDGALKISSDSYNNTVYANLFENNVLAISLGNQIADFIYNNVSLNRFYLNNFINNTQNVWVAPSTPVNFWDNNGQGNYWSNFQGVDSNGDGISETAYVITSNNTDHYPFMQQIDLSAPILPSASLSPSPSPTASQSTTTIQEPSTSAPTPTPQIPEFFHWSILLLIVALTLIIVNLKLKNNTLLNL